MGGSWGLVQDDKEGSPANRTGDGSPADLGPEKVGRVQKACGGLWQKLELEKQVETHR